MSLGSRFLHRVAAAFFVRDFRVLWFGAFTSSVGTWMQKVAQNWLVLTTTGSQFYVGLDSFLGELPILLFTLVGGVVADRHDRRRLLLLSQCVQMSSAFTLTVLAALNKVHIWEVLALSFISGTAQSFGAPAYQSLLPNLVSKEHVPNAIAMNSIQFNLARVIGPMLAGLAFAAFGAAACFGLNGLSFLVVILALLSLHVTHAPPTAPRSLGAELRGGVTYVRQDNVLVELIAWAFIMSFLGFPLQTMLAAMARDVFKGDANTFSQLLSSSGAGAVAGALVVAWIGRRGRMGMVLLSFGGLVGALMIAVALTRVYWLTCVLLFCTSGSLMIGLSLTTSLVQLIAPNEMRGRVVSIYMMAFRGGMPLGSLTAGSVASATSTPMAIGINGALIVIMATAFLAKSRKIREIRADST